MKRTLLHLLSITVLSQIVGCSSAPHDSGVAGTTRFVDLNDNELGALCDFEAAQLGGYGGTKECSENGRTTKISAQKDQASCVAALQLAIDTITQRATPCEMTVDDYQVLARSSASCHAEPGYVAASDRFARCTKFSFASE